MSENPADEAGKQNRERKVQNQRTLLNTPIAQHKNSKKKLNNDLPGVLNELRAAYRAYQNAKRDHKERIREKYKTVIADEVRKAVESEKYNFASLLSDRKERFGLKVTDIQDHVLRTRNWKIWEELRDYADIAPEQVKG